MLANTLKKILVSKALVLPKMNSNIILQEENVMTVEVAEIPSDIMAVDMRRVGCLSGMKEGNWKQICDYLIVFNNGHKDFAIFVELKKTLYGDEAKGMEQLRRSLPYLKFLHSVCEIHAESEPAKSKISVLYSLIGKQANNRLDKQRLRARNPLPSMNYKGITVGMFVGERIRFSSLIRG